MKVVNFIKNHFHQKPISSKTTFIKNHFHQKIKNHFHQKTIFIKNHFHQKPFSSKTSFIRNHFHQKPLSSKTTFIKNHFHQKPFSSETIFIRNHFYQKPLSSKTIFIKKTFSSKNIFIKNHFHQKPFSSETISIKNHFHQSTSCQRDPPLEQKQHSPCLCESVVGRRPATPSHQHGLCPPLGSQLAFLLNIAGRRPAMFSRKARWGSKGWCLGVWVFRCWGFRSLGCHELHSWNAPLFLSESQRYMCPQNWQLWNWNFSTNSSRIFTIWTSKMGQPLFSRNRCHDLGFKYREKLYSLHRGVMVTQPSSLSSRGFFFFPAVIRLWKYTFYTTVWADFHWTMCRSSKCFRASCTKCHCRKRCQELYFFGVGHTDTSVHHDVRRVSRNEWDSLGRHVHSRARERSQQSRHSNTSQPP